MKHILGMVKPHPDFQDARVPKIELDYLRLLYAVSELRHRGENAQGYFLVTADVMLSRLGKLERDYHGKDYAKVLRVSPDYYLGSALRTQKMQILSGFVRDAVLDKGYGQSAASIHRNMREFILAETILGYEPDVRQLTDENRFPFHVPWDYYGIVEDRG